LSTRTFGFQKMVRDSYCTIPITAKTSAIAASCT
jgi:hypothetical protein